MGKRNPLKQSQRNSKNDKSHWISRIKFAKLITTWNGLAIISGIFATIFWSSQRKLSLFFSGIGVSFICITIFHELRKHIGNEAKTIPIVIFAVCWVAIFLIMIIDSSSLEDSKINSESNPQKSIITLHPATIMSAHDPFATPFIITNENPYPIFNVLCQYSIDSVTFERMQMASQSSNIYRPTLIRELDAKKSSTFFIDDIVLGRHPKPTDIGRMKEYIDPGNAMGVLLSLQIRIMVFYDNRYGTTNVDSFKYRALKNYSDVYEWSPFAN